MRTQPFFVWLNFTHMHLYTHTKPIEPGPGGRWQSPYHDTMIDHDKNVGDVLDYLDELGIADNTFVMYSTDNGPHMNSWPDGGMTPFRSEKNTNWEGAFRVPLLVRWPGQIKAGTVSNEIVQHHDWLPTFLAMAGEPDIIGKLKKGDIARSAAFKNHIDGYNLVPYLTGKAKRAPGRSSSTSATMAMCLHSLRQLEDGVHGAALPGHFQVWAEPFVRAAVCQDLQPADRSVRACRHHLEHLLGLVSVQGLLDHGGSGYGRPVPGNI